MIDRKRRLNKNALLGLAPEEERSIIIWNSIHNSYNRFNFTLNISKPTITMYNDSFKSDGSIRVQNFIQWSLELYCASQVLHLSRYTLRFVNYQTTVQYSSDDAAHSMHRYVGSLTSSETNGIE